MVVVMKPPLKDQMIYFINDSDLFIKIGYTANSATKRLASLQIGNPRPLSLELVIEGDEPYEAKIHTRFWLCHCRGEWFYYTHEIRGFMREVGKPNEDVCVQAYRKYADILDRGRG